MSEQSKLFRTNLDQYIQKEWVEGTGQLPPDEIPTDNNIELEEEERLR
jgi:hypothetical protein